MRQMTPTGMVGGASKSDGHPAGSGHLRQHRDRGVYFESGGAHHSLRPRRSQCLRIWPLPTATSSSPANLAELELRRHRRRAASLHVDHLDLGGPAVVRGQEPPARASVEGLLGRAVAAVPGAGGIGESPLLKKKGGGGRGINRGVLRGEPRYE